MVSQGVAQGLDVLSIGPVEVIHEDHLVIYASSQHVNQRVVVVSDNLIRTFFEVHEMVFFEIVGAIGFCKTTVENQIIIIIVILDVRVGNHGG